MGLNQAHLSFPFVILNVAESSASSLSLIFFASLLFCMNELIMVLWRFVSSSFLSFRIHERQKAIEKREIFSLLKVFIVAAFNNIPKEYTTSFFMSLCIIIISI
jgi:hypothetical protein